MSNSTPKRIARSLASGHTRRGALVAILGSGFVSRALEDAGAKTKKKCKNGPCTPAKCVSYVAEACNVKPDPRVQQVCRSYLESTCCDGITGKPGNTYKKAVVACVRSNINQ